MTEGSHWDGCWRDRRHHECAVAAVERLEADNAALREALVWCRDSLVDAAVTATDNEVAR